MAFMTIPSDVEPTATTSSSVPADPYEFVFEPERIEQLCLDDEQLAQLNELASRCDDVYGPARDIEWAFAGDRLYLLQRRTLTAIPAFAAADRTGTR